MNLNGRRLLIASAKLTLLSGSEKTELQSVPVGERLEARGNFKLAPGSKSEAMASPAGKKPFQVRFGLK